MDCHTHCGGTAVLQIGFGCEELHTETMHVCETCAELFRDYARSNSLVCGTCDRLCIEFLQKYPGEETTGIAMAGNLPPETNSLYSVCLHAVIVAGCCTTCGATIPDPNCPHGGRLAPIYTTSSGDPVQVMCGDCGGHLDPREAAAICTHQYATQLTPGGDIPEVTAIRCVLCGLRPYVGGPP